MTELRELVILSLEPWDDVWRRNQLLVQALCEDRPGLRVLFVDPPLPALRNIRGGRPPKPSVRQLSDLSGVSVLQTVEWIPDRLLSRSAPTSGRAVLRSATDLGITQPVLWINNHSLARFALRTGWPTLYDITDDWLLADLPAGKRRRAELDDDLLIRRADTVVVCSPALEVSRGSRRHVEVIQNGVDLTHLTKPQARPDDLGPGVVAVYAGTLHDERLDVALCCAVADALPDVTFAYVGPDCLRFESRNRLSSRANVRLLGPRPYAVVPAYLQHADALIVPHLVSAFTETLDPIKARECLAVGRPTVATPIAGFRDLGPPIGVAEPADFATELAVALREGGSVPAPDDLWTWTAAAGAFGDVLDSVSSAHPAVRSRRRGRGA